MNKVKSTNGIPECPNCKKPTEREGGGSTCTLMGVIRRFDKDGKDISVDRNITTSTYFCCECNNSYKVKYRAGESWYAE